MGRGRFLPPPLLERFLYQLLASGEVRVDFLHRNVVVLPGAACPYQSDQGYEQYRGHAEIENEAHHGSNGIRWERTAQ